MPVVHLSMGDREVTQDQLEALTKSNDAIRSVRARVAIKSKLPETGIMSELGSELDRSLDSIKCSRELLMFLFDLPDTTCHELIKDPGNTEKVLRDHSVDTGEATADEIKKYFTEASKILFEAVAGLLSR